MKKGQASDDGQCKQTLSQEIGRGERIRTSGPCLPKTVLYQAELLPDLDPGMRTRRCPGAGQSGAIGAPPFAGKRQCCGLIRQADRHAILAREQQMSSQPGTCEPAKRGKSPRGLAVGGRRRGHAGGVIVPDNHNGHIGVSQNCSGYLQQSADRRPLSFCLPKRDEPQARIEPRDHQSFDPGVCEMLPEQQLCSV